MIDAPSKGIKAPAHPYVEAIVDGVSESDRKRNREREERESVGGASAIEGRGSGRCAAVRYEMDTQDKPLHGFPRGESDLERRTR